MSDIEQLRSEVNVAQTCTMEIITKDTFLEYPPNVALKLREKYNLGNDQMGQSVDILEDWIKKQKHFTNKNFSRLYLEIVIISCKGSVEKAKKQIDKLCTFRTILPKFFVDRDVKRLFEDIKELATFAILPKMTKEYQRVTILKINEKEFTSSHYLVHYKLVLVIAEYLKAHDCIDGFVIINDFRDVNLMDLITKINLIELQQFVTILTEGFGARLKGIHILSQSKAIDLLIKIIKPVFPSKIAGRIHAHQDIEELHDVVEKELLPIDLGGNERSMKELQDKWIEILSSEEHEKYLKIMKASATDESQRQTDTFNEQYMGMPGSFRTLTVD